MHGVAEWVKSLNSRYLKNSVYVGRVQSAT